MSVCEYVMEELFGDCERFEPDPSAMVDLWNHELEANEREAASPEAILSRYIFFPSSRCQLKSFFFRFYTRIKTTKCKKTDCDGVPVLVLLNNVCVFLSSCAPSGKFDTLPGPQSIRQIPLHRLLEMVRR